MTRQDVLKLLKQFVSNNGTQKAAAKKLGISQPYLSDVLKGYRAPGPVILRALGVRESYEAIK